MRALDLAGGALGAACLAAPGRLARAAGAPDTGRARAFVRVLGARHLAQSVLLVARPTPRVRRLGALVDATHALSMAGLGLLDEEVRGPSYRNAALAAGSALLGWPRR